MKHTAGSHDNSNVINIFTRQTIDAASSKIIRISPELDGLEMLYSNDSNPEKLFSLKILCWGMREDGEIVGLCPWLDEIVSCTDIDDPLNGSWEGYYDPGIEQVFYEAPDHKIIELESAANYYEFQCENEIDIIQEVPDTIGTHAVFTEDGFRTFSLVEVLSWRLLFDGSIQGMLVEEDKVETTPVLPGDPCLFEAQGHPEFKYFFQHRIANKIKSHDPDALAAMAMLLEKK